MKAVLFDMDGTLVDSEKLWDVGIEALYARYDATLRPEVRAATVGGSAESVIRIVYDDLGLVHDQADMAATVDWLHDEVGRLFTERGLPWLPGAQELLGALAAAEVPMALVTNTRRDLTEHALDSIGRHWFAATVCGDEVAEAKPAPEIYRRAAALVGTEAPCCVAIEDSPTGTAAADAAGCVVLVVPGEVPVPGGPRRTTRTSLAGIDVADLRALYATVAARV